MDDVISRLSEIRSDYNCLDEKEEPYYRALSEAIQLVSAQQKRTGHWIPMTCRYEPGAEGFPYLIKKWMEATEPDDIDGLKCSECGEIFDFTEARNWCSECGARMEGEG
jgi:hypothetical protein